MRVQDVEPKIKNVESLKMDPIPGGLPSMGAYAPEQGNGMPYGQQQQMYEDPNQAQG